MGQRRLDPRLVGALVAWAGLRFGRASIGLERSMGWETFWAKAISEVIAGALLLGLGLRRSGQMPQGRGWWALVLLATLGVAERLLSRPYIDGIVHVPYVRAAAQGMVLLAMPLWLALLSALRWVPEAVPRKTVGAALAGVAGYCLLLGAKDMSLRLDETPALLLTGVFAMTLVWAWSFAQRTLWDCTAPVVAGCGLLISAAASGLAALRVPVLYAHAFVWAGVWWLLAMAVVVTGAEAVLWFWLLRRLELATFSMQQVVIWMFGVLVQFFLFGFLSWRLDVALGLGVAAVWTALRARLEDEEPVRLGVV